MISISIHGCTALRARANSNNGSNWVDLFFVNKNGITQEICVFFDEPALGQRFATAINALSAPEALA